MTITKKIFSIHTPQPRYAVLKEISKRWSPRYFSKTKIPVKHIRQIFEAARFAPSGHNHQPWQFFYTNNGTNIHKKIIASMNTYNQSWSISAPVLIVACAITKNVHGENPFAHYDLGASVISLILQAQSLGYYSRQIGLFDIPTVSKLLKLDDTTKPFVIVAMGKIGDFEKAPEKIVEFEMDPRPRRTDFYTKVA